MLLWWWFFFCCAFVTLTLGSSSFFGGGATLIRSHSRAPFKGQLTHLSATPISSPVRPMGSILLHFRLTVWMGGPELPPPSRSQAGFTKRNKKS